MHSAHYQKIEVNTKVARNPLIYSLFCLKNMHGLPLYPLWLHHT